ncbi:unnamed protein product [Acanthoscelides obtectus]|uniref:Helitron helicase-like domain-containing protein n=1 Tax=Acanthoscelides obtectus TaxID=200917 RepID=A0A9P0QEA2_ACAOB|nr:unnamed protein product [Acanthoscelides obtectus]CAK1627015.1 hypothetical protein AOBTE_LOCUS4223 [Acanthoscelides obtectus]
MGVYVAYVYVIEFQKRGLPHAHMLIWLEESDKILDPAAIDRLISAEFPDPIAHANLHELVKVHMLHGPCTSARCLDEEGHCSKQFPKSLREDTLYNPSGYPLYKRRPIETPIHIGRRTVDNSWVVPYNAYLLEKYEAHINVEACSSMKSVKYLLKYIYKGFDRVQIVVRTVEEDGQTTTIQEPMYNEIQMFLDVRYVSAPEAMWRIYTFEMHDMSHAIIKLFVHLPNMQQVYFNTNSTIPDVVERAATQHTTLTGWFALNTQDEEARQYTYVQIPYNYVWKITQTRIWVERQRHQNIIILGDLNVNLFADNTLQQCLDMYGFKQIIDAPTRVTNSTASLLDPIFINTPITVTNWFTLDANLLSDHKIVCCILNISRVKHEQKMITFRDFSHFDEQSFIDDLARVNFIEMCYMRNIDDKVQFFSSKLIDIFNRHSPIRTVRVSKPKAPWLSYPLRQLLKQKTRAYYLYKIDRSPARLQVFRELRNLALSCIRHEKMAYLAHLEKGRDQRKLWYELKNMKAQTSDKPCYVRQGHIRSSLVVGLF